MELLSLKALRGWQLHTSDMNHCTTFHTFVIAAFRFDKHSDNRKRQFQYSKANLAHIFTCKASRGSAHSALCSLHVNTLARVRRMCRRTADQARDSGRKACARLQKEITGQKCARYFNVMFMESQRCRWIMERFFFISPKCQHIITLYNVTKNKQVIFQTWESTSHFSCHQFLKLN